MGLIRSCFPFNVGLPHRKVGSAPALPVSRPAQRLLTLRPACLPSRLRDPLRQRLQRLRYLHHCSGCYRAERSSSRAGLAPFVDQRPVSGRRWRIRFRCWPPSAAQTVHAVFPHTAFTKTRSYGTQSKVLIESGLPAQTHRTACAQEVVSSPCCASVYNGATRCDV